MFRILAGIMIIVFWAQPHLAWSETKRNKVLAFDDELVEGVSKKPLDSLSQISDADRLRRKSHLYRKRSRFPVETQETFRELHFLQTRGSL